MNFTTVALVADRGGPFSINDSNHPQEIHRRMNLEFARLLPQGGVYTSPAYQEPRDPHPLLATSARLVKLVIYRRW
ncbi:MAG TPA: hypothetical protein VKD24_05945 [Candidatus Angelobacter sp.]|nr:hypothetical protein [Candidatus Angelobacter sp.]